MSLLWNPHAFTPLGEPVTPTASPALRVIEGEATADQLAAAQKVFYKFCMHTRLSAAPNPTEIGRLPDGSRYRITDVAGVRTMELWLEDDRRSGIVIAFSALDGSLLEGHVTEGESTTYLLSPKVKSGTRKATGVWKVRKLSDPKGGGKAVNTDVTGRIYFTGYEGRDDENYPAFQGRYGSANEYAYAIENELPNNVYQGGVNVGQTQLETSDIPVSPIPFVLQDDAGKKYAAQLVLRQWALAGAPVIDLLVGPISTQANEPVGDVVATVTLPLGMVVEWWGVSFRPDGRQARAIAKKNGFAYRLSLEISPDALSHVLGEGVSLAATTVNAYDEPVSEYSFSSTPTSSISSNHDNGNRKETIYINGIQTEVNAPVFGYLGTGIVTQKEKLLVYAFDQEGMEISRVIDGVGLQYDYKRDYRSAVNHASIPDAHDGEVNGITTTNVSLDFLYRRRIASISSELEYIVGLDMSATFTDEEISSRQTTIVATGYAGDINGNQFTYIASGGGSRTEFLRQAPGSIDGVYFNRHLGFFIYVASAAQAVFHTWNLVPTPDQSSFHEEFGSSVEIPAYATLVVKTKSTDILREAASAEKYVAYSAADPMTGALVVNLQGLDRIGSSESFKVVKSWIFAVDETGVKEIQEIMGNVPVDARAKENRLLYSL